jgi:SNW domain-containing protein 1
MMYDQRLFNQSAGIASGFRNEDAYDLYDKPLFNAAGLGSMYRPRVDTNNDDGAEVSEVDAEKEARRIASTERFVAEKGFAGSERTSAASRDGPVQFEKEEDPFGLDQFLSEAKKGRAALDTIGKRGELHAGSSGGGTGAQMRESLDTSSRAAQGRPMAFLPEQQGGRSERTESKRSRRH